MAFNGDGSQIVAGGTKPLGYRSPSAQEFTVVDATTGAFLPPIRTESGLDPEIAFSSDGNYVAAVCDHDKIKIWNVTRGTEVAEILASAPGDVRVGAMLQWIEFSRDGRRILSVDVLNTVISIWDVNAGKRISSYYHGERYARGLFSASFSPDDSRIVSADRTGIVRLWNSTAETELEILGLNAGARVYELGFSPDGRRIFADCGDTIKIWNSAIKDADTFYRCGLHHCKTKQYAGAISDFERAIKIEPRNALYRFERAKVYMETKQYDLAIADLNTAIELDPRNAAYLIQRGYTHLEIRQQDTAIVDFRDAMEIDPNSLGSLIEKGDTYRERYDLAIAIYSVAIERDPENVDYLVKRANAYLTAKQPDMAIGDFTTVIKLAPKNPEYLMKRGNIYRYWKNQHDLAIADYNAALLIAPDNPDYLIERSHAYFLNGQYELVIKDYSAAMKLDPKKLDYYNLIYRAEAYLELKQYELAVADFTRAIQLDPNDSDALSRRGHTYLQTKQYDKAAADFDRVIDADPNRPSSLNEFAWLYSTFPADKFRNGQKAIKLATKACELTEWSNASYIDTLAAAYAEAGDFESAIKWQEKAISLLTDEIRENYESKFKKRMELYRIGKPYREEP